MMTRLILRILALCLLGLSSLEGVAQERTVQNRPYTDLRTFHFGVLVGTHLQDLELLNSGPTTIDVGTDGDLWSARCPWTKTAGMQDSRSVCWENCV